MVTQTQILNALKDILSKSNGEKGHIIIDSNYSGDDVFSALVVLSKGEISYYDNLSKNSNSNIAVLNKDAFYGSLTNVTVSAGTVVIGYLL